MLLRSLVYAAVTVSIIWLEPFHLGGGASVSTTASTEGAPPWVPTAGLLAAVGLQIGLILLVCVCCLRPCSLAAWDVLHRKPYRRQHDDKEQRDATGPSASAFDENVATQLATLSQIVSELSDRNRALEGRLAGLSSTRSSDARRMQDMAQGLPAAQPQQQHQPSAPSVRRLASISPTPPSASTGTPPVERSHPHAHVSASLASPIAASSSASGGPRGGPSPRDIVSQTISQTFHHFDGNQSGYLDFRELRPALQHYGVVLSEAEAISTLRRYDDHPDGKLDADEFETLVLDITRNAPRDAEQQVSWTAAAAGLRQHAGTAGAAGASAAEGPLPPPDEGQPLSWTRKELVPDGKGSFAFVAKRLEDPAADQGGIAQTL